MFSFLKLKSTYSTYEDDIADEFYTPVLNYCICYDRATAYFSAKALANYAQGLEMFANNGYKYRLIVSSEISEYDYEQISEGYQVREELKRSLMSKLEEPLTLNEKCNLSNLAYLIARGTIDIKIAFTRQGIFHDKFGIMKDKYNNIICFRGSNNETDAAFNLNYESFDITCSWQASEFDYSKITKSINVFEKLWNNMTANIKVCDIDKVIYNKILSFNQGKVIFEAVLLENDCLILDFDQTLYLDIRFDTNFILKNKIYKIHLGRYVDKQVSQDSKLIFKENLTYPTFKKIIEFLKRDSTNRNYKFYVTDRLNKYIHEKELHIRKRSKIGIAIKQQDSIFCDKFNDYKTIVDALMPRKLREKQMWDSFYMFTMKKSSNFSVPGSGKTASVLGVFSFLEHKGLADKIVMIGPKNSFGSWIDEFHNCFDGKKTLKVFNIQKFISLEQKKKFVLFDTHDKNLLLFNYESLHSILNEVTSIIDNKTLLVFDEVHKVKAIQGQRAADALYISQNANFVIAMTGTPIPNSYTDIRNILNILYHDEYNDFFGFTDAQLKSPTTSDIEEINSKLQPFFCRTTKRQLFVPEANEDIFLTSVASETENKIFSILLMKYAKNKLALIIRLLQLESNPKMLLKAINSNGEDFSDILYTQGSIEDIEYKDYSNEIVSLINSTDKTQKFIACVNKIYDLFLMNKLSIIWCIFVDSILNLAKNLSAKGLKVACIYGSVSTEAREYILEQFKNRQLDVLITNPHTLAESVSLHSVCHDAIYFEYSYNLVHLLQSKDRIHRLGLPKNQYTQYYYFQNNFCTDDGREYSLDINIYNRLLEKEQVMLNAIENNVLETLSTSEEDIDLIFKELKL